MKISDTLLPEFDHEMAGTRKTLARVPEDKFGWKPHEKSMTMVDLASHLANIASWMGITVNQDSFDVAPKDGEPFQTPKANSVKELLEIFDKNVADSRAILAQASNETLMGNWTFLNGGQTVFVLPKVAVVRSFIFNHNVHHRAQLGVYLRLNDVAVPSIYGPSADEEM
ncbi:MAG: DinB family protein [Acidobacteria bacterium]|nr:DinB family protein [Acidobacteriota bacterium]